jgi:type IV pilus assembly protein PilO
MDFSLAKLPWYAQIGAFVVLALGAVGAFFYYYEMPAREEMTARQHQLVALRADINKGLETAKKLPEFRAQVNELENRLSNLRAILPEDKDAGVLVRQFQTVAAQSNITIKSIKPDKTITKQLHSEWPISMELDGTYHNLATFFDRVGKFTRIVNISGLDIRGKDKPTATSTVTASCTATTFVLLDKPTTTNKPGAKAAAAAPSKGA